MMDMDKKDIKNGFLILFIAAAFIFLLVFQEILLALLFGALTAAGIIAILIALGSVVQSIQKKQENQRREKEIHYASNLINGLARVSNGNDRWGFVNKNRVTVIPLKYDGAENFSEGLALVKLNGKWGFINNSGTEVIPCKYDKAWSFSEGLALVKLNGKWGFVNKTGAEIIPLKYSDAWWFSGGLARVKMNGKWGYIDKTGATVIPLIYDDIWEFSEKLARVKLKNKYGNDKYGFINSVGKEVIPLKYHEASDFRNGLADAKMGPIVGVIDKSGKFHPSFDSKENARVVLFTFWYGIQELLKQCGNKVREKNFDNQLDAFLTYQKNTDANIRFQFEIYNSPNLKCAIDFTVQLLHDGYNYGFTGNDFSAVNALEQYGTIVKYIKTLSPFFVNNAVWFGYKKSEKYKLDFKNKESPCFEELYNLHEEGGILIGNIASEMNDYIQGFVKIAEENKL
jgi:hypothetical protein